MKKTAKNKKPPKLDKTFLKLFNTAKRYLDRAYAHYSHYKVGAAVMSSNGKIFGGCNVENSSYGASMCGERTAIFKAVSEGQKRLKAVLVVTKHADPWPPCGMCRQIMSEFASPNTVIYATNLKKEFKKWRFKDLMPNAFTPKHMTY